MPKGLKPQKPLKTYTLLFEQEISRRTLSFLFNKNQSVQGAALPANAG